MNQESHEQIEAEQNCELEQGDDGRTVLYGNLARQGPVKTSDRLLDDVRVTVSLSEEGGGVLRAPMLGYARQRANARTWSVGYLLDQVVLQTSFEYASRTCAQNRVQVFMGVLCDPGQRFANQDELVQYRIYHLRVTVKIRPQLERTRQHYGLAQYHLIDELHPWDKADLCLFEDNDPAVVDSATYVASGTNRLVRIEVLRPEFSPDELQKFTGDRIRARYLDVCKRHPDLDPSDVPSQAECLNTLFKVFKNPLSRQKAQDELKTISADNKVLNSQLEANWLVTKFGFELCEIEEDGQKIYEYKPPDFTEYVENWDVRRFRESYIRKSLELIFLGKQSLRLVPKDVVASNSKLRSFQLYQTHFSHSFWYHLLGEYEHNDFNQQMHPYDTNHHFIHLSSNYYYNDRDIIKNYEAQIALDPANASIYYDDLSFIANAKGSKQLLTYTYKQNVVGHEALMSALRLFHLDPNSTDPRQLSDEFLLETYKEVCKDSGPQKHADLRNALRLLARYKESDKLKFYVEVEPFPNELQAYKLLEIDESVDIDIIETAYSIKVSDAPGLKTDCIRALYTLAVAKRSIILFNILFQQCPKFHQFYHMSYLSYQAALQYLQVNVNASDDLILEIFQRKWNYDPLVSPEQLLNLKVALTKIGFERNSKLINHFLETGLVDTNYLPAGNWPTGINNIGNTCYLNSLLQYYFTISPLREYILAYDHTASDLVNHAVSSSDMSRRRIGGRAISQAEVERSVQFVYQLRSLFHEMVHSRERYVTPTRELAYLSFSPSSTEVEFESVPPAVTSVSNAPTANEIDNEDTEVIDISMEECDEDSAINELGASNISVKLDSDIGADSNSNLATGAQTDIALDGRTGINTGIETCMVTDTAMNIATDSMTAPSKEVANSEPNFEHVATPALQGGMENGMEDSLSLVPNLSNPKDTSSACTRGDLAKVAASAVSTDNSVVSPGDFSARYQASAETDNTGSSRPNPSASPDTGKSGSAANAGYTSAGPLEEIADNDDSGKDITMVGMPEAEGPTTSTCVAKISSDQLENTLEIGRQQDVTECIGNVLYQIESASVPLSLDEEGEQFDLVKQLFYGKLKQELIPLDVPDRKRTKIERFMSLLVNIGDHPKDIYDALDSYFKDDLLTLDEDDGKVRRSVAVAELPVMLQIQIQRVYYDREKFMPFKSTEPLPFGEKLYMDRYLATDDPDMNAKKQQTLCLREELEHLKERRQRLLATNGHGVTLSTALADTRRFLDSADLDSGSPQLQEQYHATSSHLDALRAALDEELASLDAHIASVQDAITHQFDAFSSYGYSLGAVFIHRGEASYGHYWVYIKDCQNGGIWRKYNDESVTEVPESEVFDFSEENTATPYFLVYVKEGHELDIEPLKRSVA
ncbi:AaceriACL164Cp [[Ashbya] aceris (nom. inval.)]|nr:AaceriACL164Cp [[Ashbya] aceris (nom. inval.)]